MRTARLLVPLTALALLAGCAGDGDDAPDLASCLRGEWTPEPATQRTAVEGRLAVMGMAGSVAVSGESVTAIDATTITTTFLDQLTELTLEENGQTLVSSTRTNGTVSQPYTLDGDVLTAGAGDASTVQVESAVTLDGEEVDGADEDLLRALASAGAAGQAGRLQVTCSDDRLTMTTLDMADIGVTDVTITLTRR